MRVFSFLFVLVLVSGTAFGQFKTPEATKEGFAKKYPKAGSVKWKSAKDGIYTVDFSQDSEKITASFDSSGGWVQSEVKIGEEGLPAGVKQAIKKDYSDFEVDWVKKLSSPNIPVVYRVALDQDGYTVRVNFSPEGKVLDKEEERD